MTLTLEVSEKVAKYILQVPEGRMRNWQVNQWLEHCLETDKFTDEEIAAASDYTEEDDRLLAEGIAASDAGRGRPAKDALADFIKRREQERNEQEQ